MTILCAVSYFESEKGKAGFILGNDTFVRITSSGKTFDNPFQPGEKAIKGKNTLALFQGENDFTIKEGFMDKEGKEYLAHAFDEISDEIDYSYLEAWKHIGEARLLIAKRDKIKIELYLLEHSSEKRHNRHDRAIRLEEILNQTSLLLEESHIWYCPPNTKLLNIALENKLALKDALQLVDALTSNMPAIQRFFTKNLRIPCPITEDYNPGNNVLYSLDFNGYKRIETN